MSAIDLDDLPFILAPSSRPSSPSNLLLNQNDNLLLHRILLADLPRKLTGTLSNPNDSKLPILLSTTIKGQWEFSPWSSKANERRKEIEVEGPWNFDLPNDMNEWRQWEEQKKVLIEVRSERGKEKGKGRAASGRIEFSSNSVEGVVRPVDYPTPKSNMTDESLNPTKPQESNKRRTQSSVLEQPNRLSTGGDELATHQSLPTVLPSSIQYVPSSTIRNFNPPQQQQQTTLTSTLPRSKPFATGSGQKKSLTSYSDSLPRIHSRSININSPTNNSPPKKSPPKKSKKSKSSTTSTIPKLYQDVSSSIPEPEPDSAAKVVGNNSADSHQFNNSSKRPPSQSLPNLASAKLQLRDPLISGSPCKSMSMENISGWGAVISKDSLGSMMDRGGIDEEILGEQGDSEFMLTDSPTKPLPNYPLSYSDSSIPFLATGLPLDLPLLNASNPTATPPLPLETSTPTLISLLGEDSGSKKGSIGLLVPHGSGNVMKLSGRSSSRGESTEGAIELEEQVSRFLADEVDML